MATHGSMKAFNPQVDDWTTYAERLKHYLIANGITDADRKRSILLTVCGAATYKLLRSLVGKDGLDTASYDDLIQKLTEHYNPRPSSVLQRFLFYSRDRARGESIAQFVAALRDLAIHCEFGDHLSEMLRDRLVHGVNHKGIQRKLLAQRDLTFDTAFATALSVEASERDTQILHTQRGTKPPLEPAGSEEVHYSTNHNTGWQGKLHNTTQPPVSCYRCGGAHLAPQCKHKDAVCRSCGKKDTFPEYADRNPSMTPLSSKERGSPRTMWMRRSHPRHLTRRHLTCSIRLTSDQSHTGLM